MADWQQDLQLASGSACEAVREEARRRFDAAAVLYAQAASLINNVIDKINSGAGNQSSAEKPHAAEANDSLPSSLSPRHLDVLKQRCTVYAQRAVKLSPYVAAAARSAGTSSRSHDPFPTSSSSMSIGSTAPSSLGSCSERDPASFDPDALPLAMNADNPGPPRSSSAMLSSSSTSASASAPALQARKAMPHHFSAEDIPVSPSRVPLFTIHFDELLPPRWDQHRQTLLSVDAIRKPFWILSRLQETMVPPGSYFTYNIFVPPGLWAQPGAKLHQSGQKALFCEQMCTALTRLSKIRAADAKHLLKDMDDFIRSSESFAHQYLSKIVPHLSTFAADAEQLAEVGSSDGTASKSSAAAAAGAAAKKESKIASTLWKLGHAFSRLTSTKAQASDELPYIPWLARMLESSAFLDTWATELLASHASPRSSSTVVDRLHRISFFYSNVVCVFVFRDFFELLDRWVNKSRESFSRLFPKEYKPGKP